MGGCNECPTQLRLLSPAQLRVLQVETFSATLHAVSRGGVADNCARRVARSRYSSLILYAVPAFRTSFSRKRSRGQRKCTKIHSVTLHNMAYDPMSCLMCIHVFSFS